MAERKRKRESRRLRELLRGPRGFEGPPGPMGPMGMSPDLAPVEKRPKALEKRIAKVGGEAMSDHLEGTGNESLQEAVREAVDQHLRDRFAYHVPMDYLTLVRRLLQSDHTHELYELVKEEMHERNERIAYNDTYNYGSVGDKAYVHGYDDGWNKGWNKAREEVLLILDEHMQWLREQ